MSQEMPVPGRIPEIPNEFAPASACILGRHNQKLFAEEGFCENYGLVSVACRRMVSAVGCVCVHFELYH